MSGLLNCCYELMECGKRDAKEGGHRCKSCIFKSNEWQKKRRRKAGIFPRDSYTKDGICYFCGEPVVPGKKHVKSTIRHLRKTCCS